MDKDRAAAYEILKEIDRQGAYSNLAVKSFLSKHETAKPAFIRELVYGVLRQQLLIDHNIKRYASKLKNADRLLLRMGFYQLCFMASVSDYAAVNETVALCRGNKALINAVMRNFIRDGKSLVYDSISTQYSCHESIVELLTNAYGSERCEDILKNSLITPVLGERKNRNGLISIQGRSSRRAVEALDPKPGERLIDVCAAPGGKSFYAVDLMQGRGEIIAMDIYAHRIDLIEKEARRLGISMIKTGLHDATLPDEALLGTADRVICDVPCSGLGVMAKKPEIKLRGISPKQGELYPIQAEILKSSFRYLKPGGTLLYSSCTLNPRENELQIRQFIGEDGLQNSEAELVSEEQIFPHDDFDGFYIAILKRKRNDKQRRF